MAKSIGKSIGAVFAGFVVIVILSIAADTVLKLVGVLPYNHLFVSTGLILGVIFYRAVFSFIGCYLAARLAPQKSLPSEYQLEEIISASYTFTSAHNPLYSSINSR